MVRRGIKNHCGNCRTCKTYAEIGARKSEQDVSLTLQLKAKLQMIQAVVCEQQHASC